MDLPEFDIVTGPARKVIPIEFVSGVRRFVLREQTPAELVRYFRRQDAAKRQAIAQLELENDLDDALATATDLFLGLLDDTLRELLSTPADGLPPATAGEIKTLTARQKKTIIECQDELSGLAEALGNGLGLLEEALPRQVASTILSSSLAQTAPEQDTPKTP